MKRSFGEKGCAASLDSKNQGAKEGREAALQ